MKKIICFVLSISLILSLSSSVLAADIKATPDAVTSAVKWVSSETQFEELFNVNKGSSVTTHVLEQHKQASTYASAKTTEEYVYTFDIDGDGSVRPITVTGVLEPFEYGELTVEMGTLRGNSVINGVRCSVYAVVQLAESLNKMNAGITIVPEKSSVEEYLYFFIGDPIITQEMLPEWVCDEDEESRGLAVQAESFANRSSSDYVFKGSNPSSGTIGSAYQLIEFYHNSSYNRSCVGVYSNAAAIESNMSVFGYASTIVSSMKIGMTANVNYAPYIDCVHNIPEDADSGEELFNTSFISGVLSIVSDVFDVSAVFITPLEALLEALADRNRVSISISNAGTNSSVLFEYTKNPFIMEDVNFDNAPMPITFQLDSATNATGYFSAYAELEYYTVIIPSDPNAFPMYYTSPGSPAYTSTYPIYVTS